MPKSSFIYHMLNYLPESTLRGMLRSAYEIATNSRYSCFRNSDRLAYRMQTEEAAPLIPVVVELDANGNLVGRLYTGSGSTPTRDGPVGPQYAAMLSRYYTGWRSRENAVCDGGYIPRTGDDVWAEIVQCKHEIRDKKTKYWRENYRFWKVIKIWPKKNSSTSPSPSGDTPWPDSSRKDRAQKFYEPVDSSTRQVVAGKVFITNRNIGNKHDERIFFGPGPKVWDITKDLKDAWRMRIKSYREAHREDEIFGRKDDPWETVLNTQGRVEKAAWSPPLYQDGRHEDRWRRSVHDAAELSPGDMVYAHCVFDDKKRIITGIQDLFPVMISRNLYDKSPKDLLDKSLRPAKRMTALSPADRLFGWVAQERKEEKEGVAYKGRMRVVCEDGPRSDIVQCFGGDSLPLPILGQPKPAQGRFYVAKDKEGTPQEARGDKENKGYDRPEVKGLRGRKQYWHHAGLEHQNAPEYWNPSTGDRTQEPDGHGRYQEFRRPDKSKETPQRDSQNRSIKGWIKPGTEFSATLHVQNLLPEEIGALLWLFSLSGKDCHFRLGYGKPLGFGSVQLELDSALLVNGCLPLGTGEDWKGYYGSLGESPPSVLDEKRQEDFIQRFKSSMVAAYHPVDSQETETKDTQKAAATKGRPFNPFEVLKALKIPATAEQKKEMESSHFDDLDFIKGFVRVLCGPADDLPIHYPRVKRENGETSPDPKGENFGWFVKNDRGGEELSLPAVDDDRGLPYYSSSQRRRDR